VRTQNERPGDQRLVRLATLYERTSQGGRRYFRGYMGDVSLLVFSDSPAEDGTPRWSLLCEERDPNRRPQGQRQGGDHRPPPRPPEPERRPSGGDDLDDDIPF
jgi:hypothetical protein